MVKVSLSTQENHTLQNERFKFSYFYLLLIRCLGAARLTKLILYWLRCVDNEEANHLFSVRFLLVYDTH